MSRVSEQKISRREVHDWANKWRIPPKESLFDSWMSINPNLNLNKSYVTKNEEEFDMEEQKPDLFYELVYLNKSNNECEPALNDNSNLDYQGKNLQEIYFLKIYYGVGY